jgi:hypothetical protein
VAGLVARVLYARGIVKIGILVAHFSYFVVVWVVSPLFNAPNRLDVVFGWVMSAGALIAFVFENDRRVSQIVGTRST